MTSILVVEGALNDVGATIESDSQDFQLVQQIQFEEVSEPAGFSHEGATYGASFGDFNGDGWPDLWVGNHATHPNLYLNQGTGKFVDIADDVWSAFPTADTHGAAWGDFDNDGDQDLIEQVGAQHGLGDGPNHVFVNTDGTLVDQAESLGLDYPLGRGRTPLWFDWTGDGRLDVLLTNDARPDNQAPTMVFRQDINMFTEAAVNLDVPKSAKFAQLSDLSGDGRLDLIIHGLRFPQRVYDIRSAPFIDLTDAIGLPATKETRDAVIADFDGDLRPDLFILRSAEVSDFAQIADNMAQAYFLLRQEEDGLRFETTGEVGFYLYAQELPLPYIHIGADGHAPETCCAFTLSPLDPTVVGIQDHVPGLDQGVYIGYDPAAQAWELYASSPGLYHLVTAVIGTSDPMTNLTAVGFEPFSGALHDRLLTARGDRFEDQTETAGLTTETLCISGASGDFDNDMDIDVYLVCSRPVANIPNILYENQGDGTFVAVPGAGGAIGSSVGRGDSVAVADYDLDGFLDLFVTNGEGTIAMKFPYGPHQLFHNLGNGNHWIEIDLIGTISNRDGIGSQVLATTGEITQLREQGGGMHNSSQNHQRIHFGLGSYTQVDSLVIRWPSGVVQEINDIAADQLLQVVEPATLNISFLYLPIVQK